jgi:hypothetical protein
MADFESVNVNLSDMSIYQAFHNKFLEVFAPMHKVFDNQVNPAEQNFKPGTKISTG